MQPEEIDRVNDLNLRDHVSSDDENEHAVEREDEIEVPNFVLPDAEQWNERRQRQGAARRRRQLDARWRKFQNLAFRYDPAQNLLRWSFIGHMTGLVAIVRPKNFRV